MPEPSPAQPRAPKWVCPHDGGPCDATCQYWQGRETCQTAVTLKAMEAAGHGKPAQPRSGEVVSGYLLGLPPKPGDPVTAHAHILAEHEIAEAVRWCEANDAFVERGRQRPETRHLRWSVTYVSPTGKAIGALGDTLTGVVAGLRARVEKGG